MQAQSRFICASRARRATFMCSFCHIIHMRLHPSQRIEHLTLSVNRHFYCIFSSCYLSFLNRGVEVK